MPSNFSDILYYEYRSFIYPRELEFFEEGKENIIVKQAIWEHNNEPDIEVKIKEYFCEKYPLSYYAHMIKERKEKKARKRARKNERENQKNAIIEQGVIA